MLDLRLDKSELISGKEVSISGSKSESNRLLLLKALFPEIQIYNLSNSDDSVLMQNALQSEDEIIDIRHAGTAMRFLTAYFSTCEGRTVLLTGSDRMRERPIEILVNALRELGAEIEYAENEGFPPLKITGKKLQGGKLKISAGVSSQYISALLLIAPKLEMGIELELQGQITSVPYIKMTLALLNSIDVETHFEGNSIRVFPKDRLENNIQLVVESDWSSASYFYSLVALSPIGTNMTLSSYRTDSLQGDSELTEIYEDLGVSTRSYDNKIQLIKNSEEISEIKRDLINTPDLAQTLAVTCLGLGIGCDLSGLHTLKIKETDRLVALKTEMEKCGAEIEITDESLKLNPANKLKFNPKIETYHDHRMAMAFAPLALKEMITIKDSGVVSKSFPDFWNDLQRVGISIVPIK